VSCVAIKPGLHLLRGDLSLALAEEPFSQFWAAHSRGESHSFDGVQTISDLVASAAWAHRAEIALVDLGPYLGALNHTAVLAPDAIIIPIGVDPFSLQGLRNLGQSIHLWKQEYQTQNHMPLPESLEKWPT
jgi:chromosome partitioning protein